MSTGQLILRHAARSPRGSLRRRVGKSARALFVVLALAALSVLALRPICDVLLTASGNSEAAASAVHDVDGHAQAAHGSDRSPACCSSIGDGAVLKAPDLSAAIGAGGMQPVLFAALSFLLFGARFLPLGALRFAGAPPETRPYHARSARIQR